MIYAAVILYVLHRCGTWLCIVRDEHGECLVTVFGKMRIRCVALQIYPTQERWEMSIRFWVHSVRGSDGLQDQG